MKTTKKRGKLFLMGMIGLSISLSAFLLIGCASTGGAEGASSAGSLVITGIPAEYEGKFVSLTGINKKLPFVASSGKPNKYASGTGAVVSNGEARLSLYTEKALNLNPFADSYNDYVGSDTTTAIGLCIRNTAEEHAAAYMDDPDAVFEEITFENGAASVTWDDAFKAGSITITGIPVEFNDGQADIYIGSNLEYNSSLRIPNGVEITLQGGNAIQNGTVTKKIFTQTGYVNGPLQSYTITGTKDVIIFLKPQRTAPRSNDPLSLITAAVNIPGSVGTFKAVPFTNGKAILDSTKARN
jgi:hypothetical protein